MRKLTVKNFSVIQEAELEFGKITVLIGPQSSGKSLLCKLMYFLGTTLKNLAAEFAAHDRPWPSFVDAAKSGFISHFPEYAWKSSNFSIHYRSGLYNISIEVSERNGKSLDIWFGKNLQALYEGRNDLVPPAVLQHQEESVRNIVLLFRRVGLLESLSILQGNLRSETTTYIPAGTSFFRISTMSLNSIGMKSLTK